VREPFVVLDIETAPDEAAVRRKLAAPPEFTAPANYKDPAKIEAYRIEKAQSWEVETREKAGLSPTTGRVVAWCAGFTAEAEVAGAGDDERELLRGVGVALAGTGTLVTFNGESFDVPFLRARMLRYGLEIPRVLTPSQRYGPHAHHVDLRSWLTGWSQYASGTLEDWCYTIVPDYVGHKGGMSGKDVAGYVAAGRWDEIRDYCASDVRATLALLQAVLPLLHAAA